ncbi:hypothetical protein BJX65DRAFT_312863 [Aspergillus insuetus]
MHHRPHGLPANYGLRNQGYVFWDETRLKKIPLFCAPRAPVAHWTDLPPGCPDHANSPGVVARLGNVKVYQEVVGMIADEILDESEHKDGVDTDKVEDAGDGKNAENADDPDGFEDFYGPEGIPYEIHWRG